MSCGQNFFQLVFCLKFSVVCLMLLIERRLFCLEMPLGDSGQLKGLLQEKGKAEAGQSKCAHESNILFHNPKYHLKLN